MLFIRRFWKRDKPRPWTQSAIAAGVLQSTNPVARSIGLQTTAAATVMRARAISFAQSRSRYVFAHAPYPPPPAQPSFCRLRTEAPRPNKNSGIVELKKERSIPGLLLFAHGACYSLPANHPAVIQIQALAASEHAAMTRHIHH